MKQALLLATTHAALSDWIPSWLTVEGDPLIHGPTRQEDPFLKEIKDS